MKISPIDKSPVKFFNPLEMAAHLWQYRDLIRQLTWREVAGRYRGSFIGLGWSFVHPLTMLFVYTFVFSVIFEAKWGVAEESRLDFAMALFAGLITFGIFSEVITSAPTLILANVNYVKRVVFPLEILIMVRFLSALINALFSLIILTAGFFLLNHFIHPTILLLPVVWLPMAFFTLGCGYFMASLGVFIRDLGATVSIINSMLFFLTPIFYPIRAVPENFQIICRINPIALFVEDARRVVLWGVAPDWPRFFVSLIFCLSVLIFGFVWFMRSKKAFADVM